MSRVFAALQRTSSFLSKRNGSTRRTGTITLTKEPFNLTGKNTFKDSGLANSRAVGIRVRLHAHAREWAGHRGSRDMHATLEAGGRHGMGGEGRGR